MVDLPRCRRTTWADVDEWADRLAGQIRAASAVPETIVALTRGGWVPSRLLSDRLGVKRLVSLRAQHWGVTATPDGKAQLTEGLSGPVDGQKVLVVDDITDTGESLALASTHVAEQHPTRLETAACLHIASSKFVPTYYAEEIPRTGWVWVVFPWNYWEDLAALATRAVELGRGVEKVQETLRNRSGLDVPLADLERVAQFVPIR
ncbi:MAG TPA: phosphoribosyltransferase [Thermoplasmata archaeon]|nr:phosphoribosyltransferase [Thermoplasmata archaeon]